MKELALPPFDLMRHAKKRAAVAAMARKGNITLAAIAAQVSRGTIYEWRDSDEDFDGAMTEAGLIAVDLLEEELRRRGHDGVDEPVVHMGRFTYIQDPDTGEYVRDETGRAVATTIKRYSDMCLVTLLKARSPERYRENFQINHNVTAPGVIFAPVPQTQDEWLAQFGVGDHANAARAKLAALSAPEPAELVEEGVVTSVFDDPMFA